MKYPHVAAEIESTLSYPNAYDIINSVRRALSRSRTLAQGQLDEYFDEACDVYATALGETPIDDTKDPSVIRVVQRARKREALVALVKHARMFCYLALPDDWRRELGFEQ